MARRSDLEAYRKAQKDLLAVAYQELLDFWRSLPHDDPVTVARALEDFLPVLVREYGEIGATVAAEFYEDLRDSSPGARRAFAAALADPIPEEAIRASSRWAVTPLFRDRNAEQALSNVVGVTNRFVHANGRNTLIRNVERDPARPRFARVPSGATTCAFCLVTASRGAVYTSEATAEMSKFHAHCDCVPTPIWDGDDYPEGYDPGALYDTYRRALRQSDTGSLKGEGGVLSVLREQEGIR